MDEILFMTSQSELLEAAANRLERVLAESDDEIARYEDSSRTVKGRAANCRD